MRKYKKSRIGTKRLLGFIIRYFTNFSAHPHSQVHQLFREPVGCMFEIRCLYSYCRQLAYGVDFVSFKCYFCHNFVMIIRLLKYDRWCFTGMPIC